MWVLERVTPNLSVKPFIFFFFILRSFNLLPVSSTFPQFKFPQWIFPPLTPRLPGHPSPFPRGSGSSYPSTYVLHTFYTYTCKVVIYTHEHTIFSFFKQKEACYIYTLFYFLIFWHISIIWVLFDISIERACITFLQLYSVLLYGNAISLKNWPPAHGHLSYFQPFA